uniref:Fe2OG dioxygenase domain-containing protein n=1 Tax=Chenopodium quinoa TaxID=63459 RepID=A0A803MQZ5_CHEQI
MSPAAGPMSPSEGVAPAISPAFTGTGVLTPSQKDKVIEWYRGEFAASNAIIDALCHHLVQINGGSGDIPADYDGVFSAIHRRRLNWIPVLQMQKYFTISDVAHELRKAAAKREKFQSSDCKVVVLTGSHEVQPSLDHIEICDNHEDCTARREQIKLTKGFVAKEPVKGHMASSSVNVVKGLKMYENIFTDQELVKLNDFVDELRAAGQNGELIGETYILFNKQMKANKREQIQLGVPIFGQIKDETTQQPKTNIEEIPAFLHSVIDHLVQWQVLPENRKPNGCIINFFDEGEYSQPFLKPPHLDQPLCTLILSESSMSFGRTLVNDGDGNFKGQLMLSVKQGSLLVMRNNSADMARHVMCASPSKRVSITFSRVRPDSLHNQHSTPLTPLPQAMTMWQPGMPIPQAMSNGDMDMIPEWGFIRAPVMMLAPVRPVVMNPRRMPRGGGTGVFLPWAVSSRKPAKHLPPRAQKGRYLPFTRVEEHVSDTMSDPGVEGRVL